jgi:hypothetical protein
MSQETEEISQLRGYIGVLSSRQITTWNDLKIALWSSITETIVHFCQHCSERLSLTSRILPHASPSPSFPVVCPIPCCADISIIAACRANSFSTNSHRVRVFVVSLTTSSLVFEVVHAKSPFSNSRHKCSLPSLVICWNKHPFLDICWK